MKIGIDIGGSHIACGLVEEGKIIYKREKDFQKEDRKNIEEVIKNTIFSFIDDLIEEKEIAITKIEKIRTSKPRNK